jgi:tetratricopeptide (TPR) repeat protein/predicted Ser/Thr protein kinase
MSEDRALNAFLRQYLEDRAGGRALSVGEYQARFPGHDRLIADYFARDGAAPGDGRASRIGRFEVVREIGRGGQGVVYLAEDPDLGRPVAIKVLTGLGGLTPDRVARFLREAEVASRLDHPGIATVHEIGTDAGVPYLVMRYLEGRTLAAAAADLGPGEAVKLAASVARGLHAAHEAGIVHRDIKPGNVFVTGDGQPVILDFGLAHDSSDDAATLTRSGDFFGTPAYMSPEQVAGGRILPDRRTDVWSLGATLYECVTGRRPFDGPTRERLYRAIITEEPASVRRINPALSRDLDAILETALQKDPDRRYRTAAAMADDLEALAAGRPVAARRLGPLGRATRWARREPAKASLLVAVMIALPVIATLLALHVSNRAGVEAARRLELQRAKDEKLARATDDVAARRYPEAVRGFEEIAAMEGGSVEAAAGAATAHLLAGRPSEALASLDAHRRSLGALRADSLIRALALRKLGRGAEADAVISAAPPAREPVDHYVEGVRLLEAGDAARGAQAAAAYRGALRHFEAAIALSSTPRPVLYQGAAHAAHRLPDPAAASAISEALRRHWPRSPSALRWAGIARSTSEKEAGLALVEEAIVLEPAYADAHHTRAVMLHQLGRFADAVAAQREVLRLAPHHKTAHHELGSALWELGEKEEAEAACREALSRDPSNAGAWFLLGAALKARGDRAGARDAWQKAITADPGFADPHVKIGNLLFEDGRREEAIAKYQEAVRLLPTYAAARQNLAHALHTEGRAAEAVAAYRELLSLDAGTAEVHYALANVLEDTGRHEEAIASYREALRVRPDYAEAHCNLSRPLIALGRYAEALGAVSRGHELGLRRPDWQYPSDRWVAHAEELVARERRMLDVAAGKEEAAGPADLLVLARTAAATRRFALAVTWYAAAFEADDYVLETGRDEAFEAACAAVQAAETAGADSRPDAGALREQALGWLTAARPHAPVASWLSDARLAPVRDDARIAAMPPDQRAAWWRFWAEVRIAAR